MQGHQDGEFQSSQAQIDGEKLETKSFVIQVVGYFFIQGSIMCLAFIGSKPFISNDGQPGQVSTMFLITVIQGFLMQHLTCDVMLCHLTKQRYSPFGNRLNVAMCASSLFVTAIWFASPDFYERHIDLFRLICIMLGLTVICQWHFLLNTVSEIAHALGIFVFKVKEKQVVTVQSTANEK